VIFVLGDNFSSYTSACLCLSEKHQDMRDAIVRSVVPLMMNEQARVRLDNAPGLTSLAKDPCLSRLGIRLEYGDTRNVNKNPVCEKAIRELEQEIVRLHPEGGLLSDSDIQVVLKVLNNRIRNRGFTAQEIMFQRELSTGNPLSMNDENLRITLKRSSNTDPLIMK